MLRVRCVLLAAAMLLPWETSFAQSTEEARNALYLELLGNGGLFSLNYEREVADGMLARAGFGTWSSTSFWSEGKTTVTTVPLTIAFVRGRGDHRLELGGGMTFGRTRETFAGSSAFVSLTGLVGYRYEQPGRGYLFRAGATPFYGLGGEDVAYPDRGFFPLIGVSFGYSF
jgi:hypothetical protein